MITNLLWTVLLVSAQTPTPADTLRQLDSAWARSYATNDTVLASKLFDDSLIVTGSRGRLKGKRGEMAEPRVSDPLFPHQRCCGSTLR